MQFKYNYHCVIASLDLWKSVFFYIHIYMKTFILTMYGRKEMERPDKKELIVSYEKSEWQLLQKTMENTIIKACAYVQKIIEQELTNVFISSMSLVFLQVYTTVQF